MGKNIFIVCIVSILAFMLTACGISSQKDKILNEIGINVSKGSEIYNIDTHDGNGDGATYVVLNFSDDKVLQQIENNSKWKAFPLDETVKTLVYGASNDELSKSAFLIDNDEEIFVPEIENGYYMLIDKHSKAGTQEDILERSSFNFTIAIYDTDNNELYFCKKDT